MNRQVRYSTLNTMVQCRIQTCAIVMLNLIQIYTDSCRFLQIYIWTYGVIIRINPKYRLGQKSIHVYPNLSIKLPNPQCPDQCRMDQHLGHAICMSEPSHYIWFYLYMRKQGSIQYMTVDMALSAYQCNMDPSTCHMVLSAYQCNMDHLPVTVHVVHNFEGQQG